MTLQNAIGILLLICCGLTYYIGDLRIQLREAKAKPEPVYRDFNCADCHQVILFEESFEFYASDASYHHSERKNCIAAIVRKFEVSR